MGNPFFVCFFWESKVLIPRDITIILGFDVVKEAFHRAVFFESPWNFWALNLLALLSGLSCPGRFLQGYLQPRYRSSSTENQM